MEVLHVLMCSNVIMSPQDTRI